MEENHINYQKKFHKETFCKKYSHYTIQDGNDVSNI